MSAETGHILVVDDNRMNQVKLSRSLEKQGHSVNVASDGAAALEMLQHEAFDVVLLDIMMPIMDGYAVLAAMQEDSDLRRIPVIVISALDELDSAVRCIEMGAEDYLPKDFNPVFLKARIDSSLRRKKLRDLEQAYLKQEVMLRQSEKLATLGRLSAGMAHELNNPASAALSGSAQVQTAFQRFMDHALAMSAAGFATEQIAKLEFLMGLIHDRKTLVDQLSPIERSDRESDLELWLDEAGLEDGWEYAPSMVQLGLQDNLKDFFV